MKWLWAWIVTQYWLVWKYRGAKDSVREMAAAAMTAVPTPMDPAYPDILMFPRHKGYVDWLAQCKANLLTYKLTYGFNGKERIAIGDSITDMARGWLSSIHPLLNFAKGGFRIDDMIQLLTDLIPYFIQLGFKPAFILLGTPGGNDLIQRYAVRGIIQRFGILFGMVRNFAPTAKILVYDLPSSTVPYIIESKPAITDAIKKLINSDVNASMLLLIQKFVAAFHLLPKNDMSPEGVHMTPLGMLVYDGEIESGFNSVPRTILL
jgi:hypothetical protein